MTKSELIERLVLKNPTIPLKNIENAVKEILEQLSCALENSERVEIRGFGSFSLHFRQPRVGRNPKTGEQVDLDAKSVPHFKAGKELRERIDICS
ncbi:integration host factor subunit beta [Canicola haemoglobinophilus]|uniref:Integration host factor subunit beta n=1 Tax=Canicola haemoglobinophilus TaxID=733 RepID=A0A1V4B0P6_9PAST|nr:integration host factor subunit beta [Canicola haemoglobinophilus]OOS00071.1 integration host factor subunit beta [Canicola haemoglobinophilus]STO53738.1 integration host factor subunit beta [Canicola haemoglobinophilus]STO60831.1 integration host factor subunit beta [Canicola haemoglobinophilus]STO68271.1 integration host factor subunit beta [Canicola haemoglobinophilus]